MEKIYKITFTISDYVQGGIYILRPTSLGSGSAVNANGTYTFTTIATQSTSLILFTVGTTTLSIDNVSIKEVRATTVEASKCLADAIHRIGIQDIQN